MRLLIMTLALCLIYLTPAIGQNSFYGMDLKKMEDVKSFSEFEEKLGVRLVQNRVRKGKHFAIEYYELGNKVFMGYMTNSPEFKIKKLPFVKKNKGKLKRKFKGMEMGDAIPLLQKEGTLGMKTDELIKLKGDPLDRGWEMNMEYWHYKGRKYFISDGEIVKIKYLVE